MLLRMGVIVIIHDKSRNILLRQKFHNILFSAAAAGKAEIQKISVQPAGNDGLIAVTGTGSTAALRDGGTVIQDGFLISVLGSFGESSILLKSDIQMRKIVIEGEIDDDIPFLAAAKMHHGLISVLCADGRNKGSEIGLLAVFTKIQIKPRTAGKGHMGEMGDCGHDCLDGYIVRIRAETNAHTGSVGR